MVLEDSAKVLEFHESSGRLFRRLPKRFRAWLGSPFVFKRGVRRPNSLACCFYRGKRDTMSELLPAKLRALSELAFQVARSSGWWPSAPPGGSPASTCRCTSTSRGPPAGPECRTPDAGRRTRTQPAPVLWGMDLDLDRSFSSSFSGEVAGADAASPAFQHHLGPTFE